MEPYQDSQSLFQSGVSHFCLFLITCSNKDFAYWMFTTELS